jgi:hypothetical protein
LGLSVFEPAAALLAAVAASSDMLSADEWCADEAEGHIRM